MLLLFIALVLCFTAWGIAQDLTTPMVAGFKRIFDMSTLQASLVQLAYFGAYFLLALPAAFINRRFGYKAGELSAGVVKALWSSPVLLSIAHGEAMSPRFQEGFYEAGSTYVRTRNADAFAEDLEDAVAEDKIPPR